MAEAWITPVEFHQRTGVPLKTVYRWIERGVLPCKRLPGSRRVQIDFVHVSRLMSSEANAPVTDNVVDLDSYRRGA